MDHGSRFTLGMDLTGAGGGRRGLPSRTDRPPASARVGRTGGNGRTGTLGLYGTCGPSHRAGVGLPYLDARVGDVRVVYRRGHVVGCLPAGDPRRGRSSAGPDPCGGRLGRRLGNPCRVIGVEGRLVLQRAGGFALGGGRHRHRVGRCATMAVWRRGEGWAFAAAPGVNLAASLVVWYAQTELFLQDGWVLLVQANVIASAVVALAWLAARKRLYELRDFTVRTSPLLAIQTSLGVIGSGILWIPGVAGVVLDPSQPLDFTPQLAGPAGWTALFLAAAAAAWYLRQVSPRDLVHVAAGFGLAQACS